MINNQNNDKTKNSHIDYDRFLRHLNQGREIEFFYNEVQYFISNEKKGRAVWIGKKRISSYFDDNPKELLHSFKINNVSLVTLIKQRKIIIITIF
ncbi:hypothetical protein [Paraliobacillus salinarum]|uniref:hypothetical protein n=1 Tax=Paraliobacillus salinarum TaxID=1158996 RepID=UPI0015F6CB93|nr:hypothetical protein [Paraliobacillus salinarum]